MAYPYSITSRATGTTLTAAIYNADHQAHADNQTPENTDDYSTNAAEMQATTDPYPAATESLATTLDGELQRLRYILKQITNMSQWYVDPVWTSVAFATANFLATGGAGGRWILASGDQVTYAYSQMGQTMIVGFALNDTTVSGTPTTLHLKIPNSKQAKRDVYNPITTANAGTAYIGYCYVSASGNYIVMNKNASASGWVPGSNTTDLFGQITFEVK